MDACVRRFAAATALTLPEAAARASGAAARLLGLEGKKGSLGVGFDADLVVLDGEGQVSISVFMIVNSATIPS
jgi:N-acetylglucosamine-6-phosphate deacetylase